MTEVQLKDFMPGPHQRIWCGFHNADFEVEYEILQVLENGIIVAPTNKKRKRVYFVPFTALDFIGWYPKEEDSKEEEVREDD